MVHKKSGPWESASVPHQEKRPRRLVDSRRTVSTVEPESVEYRNNSGSHLPENSGTNQHPQVPMFSLVPCATLPNTISTHFARDEIQRVATKHLFQKHLQIMIITTFQQFYHILTFFDGKTHISKTSQTFTMLSSFNAALLSAEFFSIIKAFKLLQIISNISKGIGKLRHQLLL